MTDRDVERDVNTQQFVATLRRIADALEARLAELLEGLAPPPPEGAPA